MRIWHSFLLIIVLALISLPAFANVQKEQGSICFSDDDGDGKSEHMQFPIPGHSLFSIYPDDPLGDFIGDDATCGMPKSYTEFPDLFLTGELGYTPGGTCMDGEMPLVEDTYSGGYKLFLLDSATCTYIEAMSMDIVIKNAPLQMYCPDAKFAFEFNKAQINNFISSPILDYFAAQPDCPLSWGVVDISSASIDDVGALVKTGQSFCADAQFTYLPGVACSGCDDCGVESNGRMMTQMARHHYMTGRAAVCSDPSGEGVSCTPPMRLPEREVGTFKSAAAGVEAFMPDFGKLGLQALPSTPEDLVEFTNATDLLAMDHFKDGLINGSFLILETQNRVYEHTKTVCDRASGDVLEHVIDHRERGMVFPIAVLTDLKKDKRSYAVSFVIADDGAVYSRWRISDYPALEGRKIYNVQLWSCSLQETIRLLNAELDRIEEVMGTVAFEPEQVLHRVPSAYFLAADKLGATTAFHLGGQTGGLHLEGKYYPEDDPQNAKTFKRDLAEGGRQLVDLPLALDAQVKLVNDQGVVLDEVYLTDGAFTSFDDTAFEEGSSSMQTSVNENCRRDDGEEGDLALTGCAQTSGMVDSYAVITRTLAGGASPYDVGEFDAISFDYQSNVSLVLCMESRSRYGLPQSCVTLPATKGMISKQVRMSDFSIYRSPLEAPVLNDIVAISWNAWNPDREAGNYQADFAVENVYLRAKSVDSDAADFEGGDSGELSADRPAYSAQASDVAENGCQGTPQTSAVLMLMLLLGSALVIRRRVMA